MAQAGKTRGKNGRRKTRALPQGAVSSAARTAVEAQIRRGVVPGAEPELCPVCKTNSEGWYIEGGKRTWYHFGRSFTCVEKTAHIAAEGPERGPVPGVW